MSNRGFWTNNPCCPTWSATLDTWWKTRPPRLCEPGRFQIQILPIQGIEIREAIPGDSSAISEFWNRYFSTSSRCVCVVPRDHIEKCVKDGLWQIILCIDKRLGILVGTGVRRYIHNLHIGDAIWKKGAMIDYFCVHPGYRKKGIGRVILGVLQNTGDVPLPPHLILWEGLHPTIPPLTLGVYWVKEKLEKQQTTSIQLLNSPPIWPIPGSYIWSEWEANKKSREVQSWKTPSGSVIVWNTFHRRVPDGSQICIVLWSSTESSLEEFVQQGPYGVVLSPTKPSTSGWSIDSPWQLIAYNCIASPGVSFPCLSF